MDRKFTINNLKIEPSNNKKLIEDLFFNEDLLAGFAPDKSINRNTTKLDFINDRYIVLLYEKKPVGLCIFNALNKKICIAHIGIKKNYRGKIAFQFGKLLIKKLFERFIMIGIQIRKENKAALYYAIKLGFKFIGGNKTCKFLELNHG